MKDLSKVDGNAKIKLTVTALGANGSTDREKDIEVDFIKEVEASVTLASKQIELGNKNTYTIRYSVDSLGLTPSVIAKDGSFKIFDEEGTEKATYGVKLFATETSTEMVVTDANARKAKFIGFTVPENNNNLKPGSYTVKMHVGEGNSQVIGEGELEVVNSGAVIKLIEALCDENGVLQAVGTVANGKATYDVEKAIILKGATLVQQEAQYMIDLDATETSASWVKSGSKKIEIAVNDDDHNDINNTVRNLSLYYRIDGTSSSNIEVFDFQVMMMSAIYSEDPTQVITVENKNIFFTATPNANPADNKFDLASVVKKAVFACGNKAGQEYLLFPTFKAKTPATDPEYLPAYDHVPYRKANETISDNSYKLLTDKDGVWTVFTKAQLKDLGLLDADALNKIGESANLYLDYSKDNILTLDKDNNMVVARGKLTKTIKKLQMAWLDAYEKKLENGVYSWKQKENLAEPVKEAAKPFNTLKSTLSFATYKNDTQLQKTDGTFVTVGTTTGVVELISKKRTDEVPAGIDKYRETLIKSVEIKFNDEELAEKFVTTTSWNDTKLANDQNTVVARQDYDSSQLVDNQITLDATITIVDVWGMKMEVPFKVTCKVNPN